MQTNMSSAVAVRVEAAGPERRSHIFTTPLEVDAPREPLAGRGESSAANLEELHRYIRLLRAKLGELTASLESTKVRTSRMRHAFPRNSLLDRTLSRAPPCSR